MTPKYIFSYFFFECPFPGSLGYDNIKNTRKCTGDQNNGEDTEDSCRITPSMDFPGCTKEDNYGYADGQPCVAISINRLVGWYPVGYPFNSAPQAVKEAYDPKYIAISCEGEVIKTSLTCAQNARELKPREREFDFSCEDPCLPHVPRIFVQFWMPLLNSAQRKLRRNVFAA